MYEHAHWFQEEKVLFPYSSAVPAVAPMRVVSGQGSYLELEDGKRLLDGISSWWSVCHGYSHPYIVGKMQEQLAKLSHVMFCRDLIHEGAYVLASRIAKLMPPGLDRVFFADSGSMAVEVALKLAVQYWYSMGKREKHSFIYFKNSYHGDSMGCISISDPAAIHGDSFTRYCPKQYLLDIPASEEDVVLLQQKIEGIADKVAAIIVEPLLQAAGGMVIYPPHVLATLRKIAKENEILFIADEVATGFYRLGTSFACEQASIQPDIMVIGKALSGGTCPLSAAVVSSNISELFISGGETFMHGNTFMAHPLSCAAANASLDLFAGESYTQKVSGIERILKAELEELHALDYVCNVRIKGAMAAFNIKNECMEKLKNGMTQKLLDLGIWIRPIKTVMYVMPPLTIAEDELLALLSALKTLVYECRR
ncbi:adenosylmethionine--8-amino-7-oxononanoate transaminase [Anaplasma phagocytophilum str. Norway variant1]|uniref:Adenosylmethionine-8-amino-7-oxononanoate aminotransferase n=1 Tax=Anaplasma phagocytophilum str. Norway variant1 TaxID=1392506 RepID=A0A7H9DYJ7_ANAPH|nr:adenosylmethionine--8-amino-7-oxononanoate transaminase [Anaplasma phagocytophilum]QLL66658.1 adenosylmethionine--8-amino-7-oxononanoate transaminase [Anaplasma phagocytophilum str. Norway variant1]